MPRSRWIFVLTLFVAALVSSTRTARATEESDKIAFDHAIDAELRAKSPEAADLFAQANAARERDDDAAAAELYTKVLATVPDFVHAKRRLCSVEARLGHRFEALRLCRDALRADDSAENRAALAGALVTAPSKGARPPDADVKEALLHANRATELKSGQAFVWGTLCQVALSAGDVAVLERCSSRLEQLAPEQPSTYVFVAIAAAANGDESSAHAALDRARAHGLSQAEYERLGAHVGELDGRPAPLRWITRGAKALAWWLVGLAALLAAAWLLSGAALRASERVPTEPGGHARGVDAALRKAYRAVLWIACAYYYVSLPLVALSTLVLGGGAIYAVLAMGYISIKLVLIVGVIVLVTFGAILKSLFVRARDVEPGTRVELGDHPKPEALLREVAERIGTRRVDTVYLTPGTEIAVTERGGLMRQLRGKSERALILGVGVLDGMTTRQLKSILAHEYGHFQNEDTAGGGFALAVRRSLFAMAIALARGGAATWYNPAWWFVRGFERVFLRVSHGASRLQEVLADRWAAFAYGSVSFESGMRHVIARSVAFDAHADATLKEVIEKKGPLANLYAYAPEASPASGAVEMEIAKELEREPSPYDSHPSPRDRIAWVQKLAAHGAPEVAGDADDAWSLVADRDAIERKMTETLRERIRKAHGVAISAA